MQCTVGLGPLYMYVCTWTLWSNKYKDILQRNSSLHEQRCLLLLWLFCSTRFGLAYLTLQLSFWWLNLRLLIKFLIAGQDIYNYLVKLVKMNLNFECKVWKVFLGLHSSITVGGEKITLKNEENMHLFLMYWLCKCRIHFGFDVQGCHF